MCPNEEKWCSAQDLGKVESCRGETLLSNDIKYVMIGLILTELCLPDIVQSGPLENRKMPNYLPFIDILGENL